MEKQLGIANTLFSRLPPSVQASKPYASKSYGRPVARFSVGSGYVLVGAISIEVGGAGRCASFGRGNSFAQVVAYIDRHFGCGCPDPHDNPGCPVCRGGV